MISLTAYYKTLISDLCANFRPECTDLWRFLFGLWILAGDLDFIIRIILDSQAVHTDNVHPLCKIEVHDEIVEQEGMLAKQTF